MEKELTKKEVQQVEELFAKVTDLIERSRSKIVSTINIAEVYTKFEIGRYIIEYEQGGSARAQYGKGVLKSLSDKLTERYGSGWSVENLKLFRRFYQVYSNSVTDGYPIDDKNGNRRLPDSESETLPIKQAKKGDVPHVFTLPWSHYVILMRVANPDARSFYEIECAQQQWSRRQLSRQVGSSLYERLALSRDKDAVMRLAREGQTIETAADIIKDPVTLEFLGLKPEAAYTETNLENVIINKLQTFLLELGKGFLFEARQKRFTFDEQSFYVDLVFYNRLLRCYVLIDLKTGKLTHQDIGQMQMYVNYYDRYQRQDFENPTVGILLCESKSDTLVEMTLPKDSNIFASQYQLYLPDKKILQTKLRQWIEEYNDNNS